MPFSIYFALNRANGKAYVGYSKHTTMRRFRQHCKEARGNRSRYYFHNALRKHGKEVFDVLTVATVETEAAACEKERLFIKVMGTNDSRFGYNLTEGGEGTNGHKVTDKTRKLRSDFAKANNPMKNPEYRKRVSDSRMGHSHSQGTRDKIAAKAKGRKASADARAKMSAQRAGKPKPWLAGKPAWNSTPPTTIARAIEMRKDGMTQKAIGRVVGVSQTCVGRWLKEKECH